MIDPNIEPSVEVDETSDILDIVWRSSDGNESFSVVASGGKLIGISCTVEPPRSRVAWSVNLLQPCHDASQDQDGRRKL